MNKIQKIINTEGIVLQSKDASNGNRIVFIFTKDYGNQVVFVSKHVIKQYGSGVLMPFSYLQCTFSIENVENKCCMTQYDGKIIYDLGKLTYEDFCRWCYVIEMVKLLFPTGEKDINAYNKLLKCLYGTIQKNKEISALITAIQMLCVAGYDPSFIENEETLIISNDVKSLIQSFVNYSWEKPMGINISRKILRELAIYLDKFIELICDIKLKNKGVFY